MKASLFKNQECSSFPLLRTVERNHESRKKENAYLREKRRFNRDRSDGWRYEIKYKSKRACGIAETTPDYERDVMPFVDRRHESRKMCDEYETCISQAEVRVQMSQMRLCR